MSEGIGVAWKMEKENCIPERANSEVAEVLATSYRDQWSMNMDVDAQFQKLVWV